MFKGGDLIRLITEDGDGEVMRVLEDSNEDTGTTLVESNDGSTNCGAIDTLDLELVTSNQAELDSSPQKRNINSIEDLSLTDEFNKYVVSVIQSARDKGCDDRINIAVRCEHYNGESAEINYGVCIKYGIEVVSDNLGKSAHIALQRWKEDEALKVKAIPFYVDDKENVA